MSRRVIIAQMAATIVALVGFNSPLVAVEAELPKSTAAQNADPQATEKVLQSLVADLSHEDYTRRETASRALADAGLPAIKLVASRIMAGDAESSWRASRVLENIAMQGDEAALAEVSRVLAEIQSQGKTAVSGLLSDLRKRRAKLRHDRSLAELRSLGAKISGDGDQQVMLEAEAADGGAVLVEVVADGVRMMIAEAVEVRAAEVAVKELAPEAPKFREREAFDGPVELEELKADLHRLAEENSEGAPANGAAVEAAELAVELVPADAPPQDIEAAPAPPELAPLADLDDLEALPELPPEPIVAVEADALDAVEAGIDFLPALDFAFVADPGFDVLLEDVIDGVAYREALIDSSWRGSDEGLALFADVPEVKSLRIESTKLSERGMEILARSTKLAELHVKKVDLTVAALEKVRKAQPECVVYAVGPAMIGINAEPKQSPCILTSVFFGSGAYEAGLAEGDEITHIDGREIKGFSDVTISVYHRQPGETLKVNYLRGGKPLVAEVKLKPRDALVLAAPAEMMPALPPVALPIIGGPIILEEEEEKLSIELDE